MTNFLSGIFIKFFNAIHGIISGVVSNPDISFGVTIIVFTIIMRILLLPLSLKQTKSTVKMSTIQPEVKKIQEKYKKDPQKAQQEVMKIYKENNVSPMGGCLPMLIQFPILIAMFYVFQHIDYQGAGFLWLNDLMKPDPYYILPVVSGLTTYFSTKSMQASGTDAAAKQAASMNIGMSIFFAFMSFKFAGALVLYWVVNNSLQLLQNLFLKKEYKKPNTEIV